MPDQRCMHGAVRALILCPNLNSWIKGKPKKKPNWVVFRYLRATINPRWQTYVSSKTSKGTFNTRRKIKKVLKQACQKCIIGKKTNKDEDQK